MVSPGAPTFSSAPADDKTTGRPEVALVKIILPITVKAVPKPLLITVKVEEAVAELITTLSPVVFWGLMAMVPEALTLNKFRPAFWMLNKMPAPSVWLRK